MQERRLEGHPNTLADGCLGPEEVSSECRLAVAGGQGVKRAKAESERKRAHASGAQFDRKRAHDGGLQRRQVHDQPLTHSSAALCLCGMGLPR